VTTTIRFGCKEESGPLDQRPMNRGSAEKKNRSPALDLSAEGRQSSDQGEVHGF
jgi:hypothetical protein